MQLIITGYDWRAAWVTLGILTLALGVVPSLLLVARRPEDMGLEPDPAPARADSLNRGSGNRDAAAANGSGNAGSFTETNFTVGQALRTRAFWLLAVFSGASLMVQAGVSLHQVSHYINQGIDPRFAALSSSAFALAQMPASLFWAALARRMPIRYLMAAASFVVALAAAGTVQSAQPLPELISAAGVGFGVGGLHLLIRLVWGGLLRPAEPGNHTRADHVGAGGRPGVGAGNRRVHVRLFRQLPHPVHLLRRGRVPGGHHGPGGQTAGGSGGGWMNATAHASAWQPLRSIHPGLSHMKLQPRHSGESRSPSVKY